MDSVKYGPSLTSETLRVRAFNGSKVGRNENGLYIVKGQKLTSTHDELLRSTALTVKLLDGLNRPDKNVFLSLKR